MKKIETLIIGLVYILLFCGIALAEGEEVFILDWSYQPNSDIRTIVADDLNGDGINELIATSGEGIIYHLTKNAATDWQKNLKGEITDVEILDFDGDGKKDLLIGVDKIENSIQLLDWQGIDTRGTIDFAPRVYQIEAADLNGDNSYEIIVGSSDSSIYAIKLERSGEETLWSYKSNGPASYMASRDIDADGNFETVYVSLFRLGREKLAEITVLDSSGRLRWNKSIASGVSETATDIMDLTDLDGDGKLEILVGTEKGIEVYDYLGETVWSYETEKTVKVVYTAELSGGPQKMVLVGATPSLYALDSYGKLIWEVPINTTIYSIYPSDLDSDGTLEILVGANNYLYLVSAGEKIASWSYGAEYESYKKRNVDTRAVYASDMDGDGGKDVLVGFGWSEPRLDTNYFSGDLRVFDLDEGLIRKLESEMGISETDDDVPTDDADLTDETLGDDDAGDETEPVPEEKTTTTYFHGVETIPVDTLDDSGEAESGEGDLDGEETGQKNPCIPLLTLFIGITFSILVGVPFVLYTGKIKRDK